MNKIKYVGFFGLLALVSGSVLAEDEKEESPWKSTAELGYVNTSGNTTASSLKGVIDISYEVEKWLHAVHADALSVKSETEDSTGINRDERIAARWFVSGQSDYKLDELNYVYGLITYEDDRFNGFDYQSKLSVGYGRWFIKNDVHGLKGEVGSGVRAFELDQIPPADGGPINTTTRYDSLVRLNGNYTWAVSKTSTFTQDLTADIGEQKEWKSVTELQADIHSALAMKLSHVVKYLSQVAPRIEHYDRITGVTLVYKF